MRASFSWLNEFVDTGLGIEETAKLLTMAGLEIEGVEEEEGVLDVLTRPKDTLFEVNVTPNRADCLSILGIARELSALTGAPLKMPPYKVKDEGGPEINVEISDPELCRRYAGRVIKNVKIGPSPEWMKKKLEDYGIRSINNIVDITNYVLIELGHPLHAFDLNTLKGKQIIVDMAENRGKKITTLDGVERKDLPGDTLLICDAERPVAIAGVMGGADTEVKEDTRDIFLESAWFKPQGIRKTAKRLGLGSESSYRFERGADIEMVSIALDRASYLMREIAGGKPSGAVDNYPRPFRPHIISVNTVKIRKLLGAEPSNDEIFGILKRLGLNPEMDGDMIVAIPPSYRLDIDSEADIVEEVARIYGYGKIPSTLPCTEMSAGGLSEKQKFVYQAKNAFALAGYNEAINYSFMNINTLDTLGLQMEDPRRLAVKVLNPLREEDAFLRTTLIPSLLENLRYNFTRGIKDIRLFEIARVFVPIPPVRRVLIEGQPGQLPFEPLRLGGCFFREKSYLFWKEPEEDFYRAKGALEEFFDAVKIPDRDYRQGTEPFLHPGKSADIFIGGRRAGYIGALTPTLKEAFEIKAKEDAIIFELDLDLVFESLPGTPVFRQIPKFPAIERDIAVIVGEHIKAGDVLAEIRNYPSPYIEDASIFDLYKGDKIEKGKKSLAFNIRYRSTEKTLTEDEIEEVHRGLVKHLLSATGGILRA